MLRSLEGGEKFKEESAYQSLKGHNGSKDSCHRRKVQRGCCRELDWALFCFLFLNSQFNLFGLQFLLPFYIPHYVAYHEREQVMSMHVNIAVLCSYLASKPKKKGISQGIWEISLQLLMPSFKMLPLFLGWHSNCRIPRKYALALMRCSTLVITCCIA